MSEQRERAGVQVPAVAGPVHARPAAQVAVEGCLPGAAIDRSGGAC